jgi:hypothetical protein
VTVATTAGSLDTTISLIKQALSDGALRRQRSSRRIATVEPSDGTDGWYQVQSDLSAAELDYISEGSLSYGSGERALTFDVLQVEIDGEQVRVRASGAAPRERLALCVRDTGLRQVLEGLLRGLVASRANPLLTQFSERQLTQVWPDRRLADIRGWPGLRQAQQQAVAACCSAGLQLVWGPPGTGKTRVIATAISHLVASGRRVLLVSSTNIAVDTALSEALSIMGLGQGQAVRVGHIQLPELAADRRVRLDRLVEDRQAEQQAGVDQLARQLEELNRAGASLAETERRLAGFDPGSYRQAAARMENRRRYGELMAAIGSAEDLHRRAQAELIRCELQIRSLACCEAADRESEIRADLAAVDNALAAHQESSIMARARRPGMKSRLAADRASLVSELARAATERRRAITAAVAAGADPSPPIRPDLAQTTAAAERVRRTFAGAVNRLGSHREEAGRLARAGLATPADERLIADEHQRWAWHESLPELRRQAQAAERHRAIVQKEYEDASERLHQERRAAQRDIVSGARLVATTLTQLALRPWLTQAKFDHVIVDEAAAAQLPHLMHAVGYAGTGAVLVGDYLQNGPISDRSFPGGPQVQDLFKTDCFSFFGVTDPQQAQRSEGCVVLTEQFRFGPVLTELANRVAYEGILTTAGRGAADIVVITVDGLPEDIRAIRRSRKHAGWWLIGALLARALAEHHYDAGSRDTFGVLVPYKAQEESSRAALEDSALARAVPVGTSHRFQGRQFGAVLADLVEDGRGRMMTANLRGGDYDAESVRLFNVAATRPRGRLYVLVGNRALEQARNGPLAALRSMVSAGRASRVDAGSLLGMSAAQSPAPDTPEADLLAALDPYVRVTGMHDEDAAIDEVIARIDQAHHSVWCWSAWVGRYAEGITDALHRASQRGVQVHVVARPEHEVQGANRESLRAGSAPAASDLHAGRAPEDRGRGCPVEHRRQHEHAVPRSDVFQEDPRCHGHHGRGPLRPAAAGPGTGRRAQAAAPLPALRPGPNRMRARRQRPGPRLGLDMHL